MAVAFNISPEQRQQLVAARESQTNVQYQVRVFCCSETYYSVPVSSYYNLQPSQPFGAAPVEFPLTCELRINDINTQANLRGVKKKEGTTMPPNVSAVKNAGGTPILNLDAGARNSAELTYINADKVRISSVNHVFMALV